MQPFSTQSFRLSPQQQGVWLAQQNSNVFISQCAIRIEGDLKPALLQQAVRSVMQRYQILRTRFRSLPGMTMPVQCIADDPSVIWHDLDLSRMPADRQHAAVEQLLADARCQPFDLEQGPIVRIHLVMLSPAAHMLLLCLPSLCADTQTLHHLAHRIAAAYGSDTADEPMADEVVQYVHFSEWQNEQLTDSDSRAGHAYWRKQKCSPIAPLRLPFVVHPDAQSAFQVDSLSVSVDGPVVSAIDAAARQGRVAPASVLLASWQIVLWWLSEATDIVVNTVVDGRRYEELAGALGLFAKPLPIRAHLGGHLSCGKIMRQVDRAIKEVTEWHDFYSVEQGGPFATAPAISFESIDWPPPQQSRGVVFAVERQLSYAHRFTIGLICVREGNNLTAEFCFNPVEVSRGQVEQMARSFAALLGRVVLSTETPLRELDILGEAERQHLLVALNATAAAFPMPPASSS